MKSTHVISFIPKHFSQLQNGEFAGNWAPVIPAFKNSDLTIEAFKAEAAQIHADGGTVSFSDAPAEHDMWEAIDRVLTTLPAKFQ